MILKWDQEILKWAIVHYSHSFDDFDRMIKIYPRTDTCIHMIDVGYIKANEVFQIIKANREKQA